MKEKFAKRELIPRTDKKLKYFILLTELYYFSEKKHHKTDIQHNIYSYHFQSMWRENKNFFSIDWLGIEDLQCSFAIVVISEPLKKWCK